jgi:PAS domain S-box-containing protein
LELLARCQELERELASQRELETLIESLQIQQEEVHSQHAALLQAQSELEASRDRYAELYDFAPVPILTLGRRGNIEMLNLAAARLLAIDRELAIGTPFIVFVSPRFRRDLLDHLSRCRGQSVLVSSELSVRSRRGEEFPVEIQSRWFERHDGAPALQTVLLDLGIREERERIKREETAMHEREEAKDRFLAVLSHELRTPLTPILLTIEVLEETSGKDPALMSKLAMIRRNAELQARLVDDLLDVTRIGHGKLHLEKSPVPIGETLRHVAELCEPQFRRARVALDFSLHGGEQHVSGDPTRLRQIFWNLLKNAVEHTPEGGRVSLGIESPDRDVIRVVVSDSGAGIDPDSVGRLFEPFEQASSDRVGSGLGLGLAICRGLVEAHGGSIEVESPGRLGGATFRIELPACSPPAEQSELPRKGEAPRQPISILLVEDHADTAAAMRTLLGNLGFEVRLAGTLDEGRRLARAPFDVLVSDVQLPDGSGLDLMRELSAAGPVKGIAISGFGSEKDVRQSREAGFDRHLVKPVVIERMVDAIQSLVSD